MATAKKKGGSTKGRTLNRRAALDVKDLKEGTFAIETDPPPPVRGTNEENRLFLEKLQRTIKTVQRGQAFLIPAVKKNSAQKWLRDNHPQEMYRIFKIAGNPDMIRVYRMKISK